MACMKFFSDPTNGACFSATVFTHTPRCKKVESGFNLVKTDYTGKKFDNSDTTDQNLYYFTGIRIDFVIFRVPYQLLCVCVWGGGW